MDLMHLLVELNLHCKIKFMAVISIGIRLGAVLESEVLQGSLEVVEPKPPKKLFMGN